MKYYALSGLFNGVVSLIFGSMVLSHGLKNKKYQTFALLCFSICFWGFSYYIWQVSTTPQNALLFCRLLMIGAILMPITNYHHVIDVFELDFPAKNRLLIGGYGFAGALISLSFTTFITKSVSPKLSFPFWPDAGFLFAPLLIYKFLFASFTIFLLMRQTKKIADSSKTSLIWVMVATIVAYISGSTNYPLWYGIPVWPILTPLVCVFLITEAFFLFRLHLLDSYLFLRDTTIHVLSSLVIATVFYSIAAIIPSKWAVEVIIFGMALFLPLLYPQISGWFRRNINRTRLGDIDRYLEDIEAKSSALISSSLSISSLSSSSLDLITSIFPVNEAAVYFMRTKNQVLHIYAQRGMKGAKDIDKKTEIFKLLEKRTDLFVREEDRGEMDEDSLSGFLNNCGGKILCPIFVSGGLSGALVFGPKVSNAKFHRKDMLAIKLLRKKIEIAVGYATAAEKYAVAMQDWSHSLNQITKPMEIGLGMLMEMGDMLTPEERKDTLKSVHERTKQLRVFHDHVFNSAGITRELVSGEYKKQPLKISDLIRASMEYFVKENKGICSFEIPDEPSLVNGNKTSIERVMGELLSNSIRHIKERKAEARVSVKGISKNDQYQVTIKDNGDGIDPALIEKIWEPGWQQKDMNAWGFWLRAGDLQADHRSPWRKDKCFFRWNRIWNGDKLCYPHHGRN